MKPKYNSLHHLRVTAIALSFAALSVQFSRATSAYWDGTGTSWSLVGSWSTTSGATTPNPGNVPGSGDTATFNALTGNTAVTTGNVTVFSMIFDGPTLAYIFGASPGTGEITLDDGGSITINSGVSNNQLFNANLALGPGKAAGSYSITNNSASSLLTFAGIISASGTSGNSGDKSLAINGSGNISISGAISNGNAFSVGITKSGAGTLTLSGTNGYTGITAINNGTVIINGSTANGAVSVAAGAKLYGTGTIGGATTVLGTQSSGASAGTVGTQNFSGNLAYSSGSIFEWDINVTSASDEAHDKVAVTGTLSGNTAIFKVALVGSGDSFASAFWDANHSWTAADLFGGTKSNANLASIFNNGTTTTNFNANPTQGAFSFTSTGSGTGNQLTWTAVPEPTGAVAGGLLSAGVLRRRRTGHRAA